jgi:hypothetical protein
LLFIHPTFATGCWCWKFAGSDGEQVQFAEDFEELADLEEFMEYQDWLHLEEVARELLDVDIEDGRTLRLS